MQRAFLAVLFLLAASPVSAGTAITTRAVVAVDSPDKGGPPMTQAVETLRRRVELVMGTQPKVIALPGRHIQIEVTGDAAFEKLQNLFKPPESLSLHRVPEKLTPDEVRAGRGGPDVTLLKYAYEPEKWLPIYKKDLPFGRIVHAGNAVNELSGSPIVAIELDEAGKKAFGQITIENLNRQIAIVLGSQVLTSPVVLSPILSGRLQIEGGLSQQQALELAARITAASLAPDPFKLVELRKIKSAK